MRNPGRGGPPLTRGPRLSSVLFAVRDARYFLIIKSKIPNIQLLTNFRFSIVK